MPASKAPRHHDKAQTLEFSVWDEDRPVLSELVYYFGDGNRSAYLRATYRVMKSIMLAEQVRDLQAYGRRRTADSGSSPPTSRADPGVPQGHERRLTMPAPWSTTSSRW